MTEIIRRILVADGFTPYPDGLSYGKTLRDRRVFVATSTDDIILGNVFVKYAPQFGVSWYATLDELDLAITYQSLRPLN